MKNELEVSVELKDMGQKNRTNTVKVISDKWCLQIIPNHTATKTDDDDDDPSGIIYLEFKHGVPFLYVWGNINNEDPTHVIDLSNALISNREVLN